MGPNGNRLSSAGIEGPYDVKDLYNARLDLLRYVKNSLHRRDAFSFQEKSTLTVLLAFVVIYGWYFATVIEEATRVGVTAVGYQGLLLGMVIVFVLIVTIAHIVIAVADPKGADQTDERDRVINRTGEYLGGYALGAGTLVALGLAMIEAPHFVIAHAILGALVLSEIVSGTAKLFMYRRGI